MPSTKVPGIPSARGTRVGIIFGSIFENRRKIVWKLFLGRFPGSQSRIWHQRRSQVYLVPEGARVSIILGNISENRRKINRNFVFGHFSRSLILIMMMAMASGIPSVRIYIWLQLLARVGVILKWKKWKKWNARNEMQNFMHKIMYKMHELILQ